MLSIVAKLASPIKVVSLIVFLVTLPLVTLLAIVTISVLALVGIVAIPMIVRKPLGALCTLLFGVFKLRSVFNASLIRVFINGKPVRDRAGRNHLPETDKRNVHDQTKPKQEMYEPGYHEEIWLGSLVN